MDKDFLESARAYLSEGFPNPNRSGCPPDSALRSLVYRPNDADPSITEHLATCSPCFKRYSELLAELKAEQRLNKSLWPRVYAWSKAHPMLAATTVVCVLFLAIGLGFLLHGVRQPNLPPIETHKEKKPADQQPPTVVYAAFSVDLSALSRVRGTEDQPQPQRIAVPASRLDLTLTLPLGSREGQYQLKLTSDGSTAWSNSGTALLQEGKTLIRVHADFTRISPGNYDLEVQSPAGIRLIQPVSIQAPVPSGHEQRP